MSEFGEVLEQGDFLSVERVIAHTVRRLPVQFDDLKTKVAGNDQCRR